MKSKFKLIAALKTWLVIYPSITLFLFLFGNGLSPLPLYQRTFILTIVLIPWMMFVGMPVVNFMINLFSFNKDKI
jgi:antibiotic biosynthesis monooxygenase (ABM) superfamily enzyme